MMVKNPIREAAREAAKAAGEKVFFDGVTCRKGHTGARSVSNGRCIECLKEKDARAYQNRREAKLAKCKERYEANADSLRAYRRAYYQNNREEIQSLADDYRKRNREKIALGAREFYAKNAPRLRKVAAKVRADKHNRAVGWDGDLLEKRESELFDMAKALEEYTGKSYQVDHAIPLRGKLVCGLHVCNNLQVIPAAINQAKKNKMVLMEIGEWVFYLSNPRIVKELPEHRETERFYRDLGWDFKRMCYTSGKYFKEQ